MKIYRIVNSIAALAIFALGADQAFAKTDSNGIEESGIYNITMKVDNKVWAWTHVVPKDQPANLIGTSPSKEKVELREFVKGEKSQQWKIRTEIEGKSVYHVYSMISAPQDNPHSPITVVKINAKFAGDGDDKFHDEYNRITVNINQSDIDRAWHIPKQSNGKFLMQPLIGTAGYTKPEFPTHAFAQERVVEAFKTKSGLKLRHRIPSGAATQQWTLSKAE